MKRFESVLHGKEFRDRYLELMATRFPAAAVERKRSVWDWLFANPCSTPEMPTGVFTVEKNRYPVGAFIQQPARYVIDGRDSAAMQPLGTVVHPDHSGVGKILLHAQLHSAEHLAIGVPNRIRLSKMYRRMGGLLTPARTLRRRVYRPGSILVDRGKMSKGLGTVVNAASWGPIALTGLVRATAYPDECLETISAFGREFDDAWEAAAGSVELAQCRSAAFLTWRYKDMPLSRYRTLALRRRGKLAGYVVTTVDEGPSGRVGRISDIFAYGGATRDYALLMAAADKRFQDGGCAYAEISFGRTPEIDSAARRTGFLLRQDILPLVVRHDIAEMHAKLPALFERIHFCRGDHDEDY